MDLLLISFAWPPPCVAAASSLASPYLNLFWNVILADCGVRRFILSLDLVWLKLMFCTYFCCSSFCSFWMMLPTVPSFYPFAWVPDTALLMISAFVGSLLGSLWLLKYCWAWRGSILWELITPMSLAWLSCWNSLTSYTLELSLDA